MTSSPKTASSVIRDPESRILLGDYIPIRALRYMGWNGLTAELFQRLHGDPNLRQSFRHILQTGFERDLEMDANWRRVSKRVSSGITIDAADEILQIIIADDPDFPLDDIQNLQFYSVQRKILALLMEQELRSFLSDRASSVKELVQKDRESIPDDLEPSLQDGAHVFKLWWEGRKSMDLEQPVISISTKCPGDHRVPGVAFITIGEGVVYAFTGNKADSPINVFPLNTRTWSAYRDLRSYRCMMEVFGRYGYQIILPTHADDVNRFQISPWRPVLPWTG